MTASNPFEPDSLTFDQQYTCFSHLYNLLSVCQGELMSPFLDYNSKK